MALISLGKIVVTNAGTPVPFTATKNTNCNAVYVQYPFSGNKGAQVYIGSSALVKATLVGCYRILTLVAAATTPFDKWDFQSNVFVGPFDLSTLYVDADSSSDFILVSYVT